MSVKRFQLMIEIEYLIYFVLVVIVSFGGYTSSN